MGMILEFGRASERAPIAHRPDLMDLFETLAVASNDLEAAATIVYAARSLEGVEGAANRTAEAIQKGEAAAERVLRAIRAFIGEGDVS